MEIGVVLVIIGLLLGAVLKGQELIASARVSNLISSMNGYKAAINAFQDRYRMMPGDSSTAATKVGHGAVNCAIMNCNDGLINAWSNTSIVNNHLSAGGFYSGPALTAEIYAAPTSTGYLNNPGGGPIYLLGESSYLTPTGAVSTAWRHGVWTGWQLSSKLLGEVDRKTDDGNGWTGGMRFSTYNTQAASGCVSATTGVWIESNPGTNCAAVELLN